MNLFRTRMFLRIDPLARIHPPYICPVHTTPRLDFPPLRTPCPVITPEPAIHRQMNSRSELRSSYHVRASITFHLSCLAFDRYDCFIFIVSPLFYCPIVSTTAVGAPVIDYVVDDRTPPTVELPGKQSHFPSPTYRLLFYILSVALGICCCYDSVLFQLHSLSLPPLVYLSDILCSLYKYIIQQWTLSFVSQIG